MNSTRIRSASHSEIPVLSSANFFGGDPRTRQQGSRRDNGVLPSNRDKNGRNRGVIRKRRAVNQVLIGRWVPLDKRPQIIEVGIFHPIAGKAQFQLSNEFFGAGNRQRICCARSRGDLPAVISLAQF